MAGTLPPLALVRQVYCCPRKTYEEAIQVLERIILPACKALGIEAIRADHIVRAGEIPEQVFRQIRDARVVIADLTGANPNVMYELGLRHTTGKLTLQIGERERLPFDVAAIRTFMFQRTDYGLVEAKNNLQQALATGLKSGGDPVTATRLWFEGHLSETMDALAEDSEEEAEDEELGFLEKFAEAEDGLLAMTSALSIAVSISDDISRPGLSRVF